VFDIVLMGRSAHLRFLADPARTDIDAARAAMERLQIGHLAERRYDTLSGGERQLTLLARALAQAAPVVVLDEPCASLDPGHQVEVLAALRALARQGQAVVMSTHLPEHALALQAQALLLDRRGVVGPADAECLLVSEVLSALYDTPIEAGVLGQGAAAGRRVFVPLALHEARRLDKAGR
jgi:iron complex transport system ATP-binding protein